MRVWNSSVEGKSWILGFEVLVKIYNHSMEEDSECLDDDCF
jgi:hypothetical protein